MYSFLGGRQEKEAAKRSEYKNFLKRNSEVGNIFQKKNMY